MSPGKIIFFTFLTQMSRFGAIFLHLPTYVVHQFYCTYKAMLCTIDLPSAHGRFRKRTVHDGKREMREQYSIFINPRNIVGLELSKEFYNCVHQVHGVTEFSIECMTSK